MKEKFITYYINIAKETAKLSYATRLQVGAIVVKNNMIISYGYNGMPSGWDNNCEELREDGSLTSKPEVLHAEMNALMKLAKTSGSGDQAALFITHSPCLECAKSIYQAGITEVYYGEDYRSNNGINFLQKCGITVKKIT